MMTESPSSFVTIVWAVCHGESTDSGNWTGIVMIWARKPSSTLIPCHNTKQIMKKREKMVKCSMLAAGAPCSVAKNKMKAHTLNCESTYSSSRHALHVSRSYPRARLNCDVSTRTCSSSRRALHVSRWYPRAILFRSQDNTCILEFYCLCFYYEDFDNYWLPTHTNLVYSCINPTWLLTMSYPVSQS